MYKNKMCGSDLTGGKNAMERIYVGMGDAL
jgi:hypothetical protein